MVSGVTPVLVDIIAGVFNGAGVGKLYDIWGKARAHYNGITYYAVKLDGSIIESNSPFDPSGIGYYNICRSDINGPSPY